MANDDRERRTLKFESRGDLLSALVAAERLNIPVEKLGEEENLLISVPANSAVTLQGLGSVYFGIEVCA